MTRRLLVGAALLGLASAGLTIVAAPTATAAPWMGEATASILFSTDGAGCSVSAPADLEQTAPLAANATTPVSQAGSTTATGLNPGDTGTLTASTTGTVRVEEGDTGPTLIDAAFDLKAKTTRALGDGSGCSVHATAAAYVAGTFTLAEPRILSMDFTRLGPGYHYETIQLLRHAPSPAIGLNPTSYSLSGKQHYEVALSAGDWGFTVVATGKASSAPPPVIPDTLEKRIRFRAEFKPLGAAQKSTSGTGTKYLTLPDAQNCAAHSVVAAFTKKAGKKPKKAPGKNKGAGAKPAKPVINKATFYVNGAKVRTVRKPHKKTKVTLDGLPGHSRVTVSVRLKVRGKGVATVERTYLQCG